MCLESLPAGRGPGFLDAGFRELWAETLGDPRVRVAVLDGPIARSHRSLAAADLTQVATLVPETVTSGSSIQHGTHIASIIFGQHDGQVKGIAPRCRGLIIPVFGDSPNGSPTPCSQLDLARAMAQAVRYGAHVINISGGDLSRSGAARSRALRRPPRSGSPSKRSTRLLSITSNESTRFATLASPPQGARSTSLPPTP